MDHICFPNVFGENTWDEFHHNKVDDWFMMAHIGKLTMKQFVLS